MIIEDVVDELTGPVLKRSSLHVLLMRYRPEVVVDCVNSATGSPTRIYSRFRAALSSRSRRLARPGNRKLPWTTSFSTRRAPALYALRAPADQACADHVPVHAASRHHHIRQDRHERYRGHGPEHPLHPQRRETLARAPLKSAVAGAHTLLLFLMAGPPMPRSPKRSNRPRQLPGNASPSVRSRGAGDRSSFSIVRPKDRSSSGGCSSSG